MEGAEETAATEETPEVDQEVKIEGVEVLEEAEPEGDEPWVPNIHRRWKDHATFTISLVQNRGHALTSRTVQ